ncbi:MAG TPA: hypothetical protein VH458_07625, partial [Vicinamibacterales bacterium]
MKTTFRRLLLPGVIVMVSTSPAWGAPAQATRPGDRSGGHAIVTNVTLEPDAPFRPQACPATLRFRGTVTAATSGMVRFRFRLNRDTATPDFEVAMKEGESRQIVHLVHAERTGSTVARGTVRLDVTDSKGLKTIEATFAVACTRETEIVEDNPLESFRERYFEPRGSSPDNPFDTRRARSYEQLRAMRKAQGIDRLHLPLPGALDANLCAWYSIGPTNIGGRVTQIAVDA